MARLKLKQLLSNLHYNPDIGQLIISRSVVPVGDDLFNNINYTWDQAFGFYNTSNPFPALVISGSVYITSSNYQTGSVTIAGIDTFGDSGSFYAIDLGDY